MEPIAILQEQKILLLYGGWSAERNISINSGTAVAGALNRNGISFTEYDLTSEEEAKKTIARIGDAEAPNTIAAAVYSGYRAGMELGREVDQAQVYGRREHPKA